MRRWAGLALAAATVVGSSGCAFVARSAVSPSGQQPGVGSLSFGSALSSDGRFAVFQSDAANLAVTPDENGLTDVFLRDHVAGSTERISVGWDAVNDPDPNGESAAGMGAVSADGRFVVFESTADNLVEGDVNGASDIFVRDRLNQTTTRVMAFDDSETDGDSSRASISADGRFVAFDSFATNLVDDDTNGAQDVFVWNRTTGVSTRISKSVNGVEGDADAFEPKIDASGRFVAFTTGASNVIANDTNEAEDVVLKDRSTGSLKRVSLANGGAQANSSSMAASVSDGGRYVAFGSYATNLVTGDTNGIADAFVRDTTANTTERISVAGDGSEVHGTGYSMPRGIGAGGRFVLFSTIATSLLAPEQQQSQVSFVRDRTGGRTLRVTSRADGKTLVDGFAGAISNDGRYVLLASQDSTALEPDANGGTFDVLLRSTVNPLVLAVSPATASRGSTVTVSLLGVDFSAASTVLMGEGVAVDAVTFVDASRLDVTITIAPTAPVGPRTPLLVDNGTGAGLASGGVAFLPDAFAVT